MFGASWSAWSSSATVVIGAPVTTSSGWGGAHCECSPFFFADYRRRRYGSGGCPIVESVACCWWVGVSPLGYALGWGWWLSGRRELRSFCFWIEGQVQIGLFVDLLPPNFSSPTFIAFPFNFTVLFLLFCWGLHSLCDVPALGRRRVIVNWTVPPSGRMRHRVAGVKSGRPHTGIAVDLPVIMRLTDVIFPVGHRYYQAFDVTVVVTHAIRCLFEYFDVLEIPVFQVLSLCFLLWGSGFMSPPCIRCFINR